MGYQIPASCLHYLKRLKENNNRDWFNANKEEYSKEQKLMEEFAGLLLDTLNTHDYIETPTGKKCMHRIYRDSRFSKDKTPYNTNWSGSYRRATSQLRGGYYFHIEPGNSFIGGGFQAPERSDLKLIRDDISYDCSTLRNIISQPRFIETFGSLRGKQLKTAPQGYDLKNKGIDLLRYQQFRLRKHFSDEEVLSENFHLQASDVFRAMRPFFNYMSGVLATGS